MVQRLAAFFMRVRLPDSVAAGGLGVMQAALRGTRPTEYRTMSTTHTPSAPALLVDAREAARLLGVSARTVWTITNRGELPSVRINRRVLYRVEALSQFAQRMEGKK
jgi:excisionase family DNA binding protein